MIRLFRYLKGYVKISFSGANAEKMLNLFAANHLNVWEMKYANGKISGYMDIASFKKLRKLKRGLAVGIKVNEKHGFPLLLKKYKNRGGLIAGLALFIILLKVFSLFIWDIEVSGNKTVGKNEILRQCGELGVKQGVRISGIDTKNTALKLLRINDKLAWAAFNIEGCRLTVNVTEAVNVSESKMPPSNIIASTDGTVISLSASSGDVLVRPGDAVKKGDILISGVTENQNGAIFSRSIGTVTANTVRSFESYLPYKETIKIPVGRIKSKSVLSLFWLKIPLYFGKIVNVKILKAEEKRLNLYGVKMPCAIYKLKYKNLKERTVERNEGQIIEYLRKEIDKQINNAEIIEALPTDESVIKDADGIRLVKHYSCKEIISFEKEIIIDRVN